MVFKNSKSRHGVGYVRVSREERNAENLGPHAQRHSIEQYCSSHGMTLDFVYTDIGVSGGKPLDQRGEGKLMVEALKITPRVVIAARQDRLFRSVKDAINQMDEFRRLGVETVCIADGLDLTQPSGRLMFNVMAAMAEYEREVIGIRTKDALAVKRRRGEQISPHAPYGYRFEDTGKTNGKGKPVMRLVSDADETTWLLSMQQRLDLGYSYRRVAQWLDANGSKMRDGRKWNAATVKKVVSLWRKRRSAENDAVCENISDFLDTYNGQSETKGVDQ